MLEREIVRQWCLAQPGAHEDFPFGDDVAIFKVKDKMFALLPVKAVPLTISLKCDPVEAEMLREQYPGAVTPGYHLNKRHWNSILVNSTVAAADIEAMIQDSYRLVLQSLKKADREAIQKLAE
jgi:predicted DNA-binding protein (MmcQ/YjbR family)